MGRRGEGVWIKGEISRVKVRCRGGGGVGRGRKSAMGVGGAGSGARALDDIHRSVGFDGVRISGTFEMGKTGRGEKKVRGSRQHA
jgi:hypothetical protein